MRRAIDLVNDLVIDFSARRSRIMLFLIGVALATGSLVTALGISHTAARQIDADIAAANTNLLTVEVTRGVDAVDGGRFFPLEAVEQVGLIDGVTNAGLKLPVSNGIPVTRYENGPVISNATGTPVEIAGATSGYLAAYDIQIPGMWMLDAHDSYDVAIIGRVLADQIGIPTGASNYTGYRLRLNDRPYEVIGVVEKGALAATTVLLPYEQALASTQSDRNATMLIQTTVGSGRPVSTVVREAIRPDRPDVFETSTTAGLDTLRTGVNTQLARFAAAIGALLLVLTTLLIANSMIVSVVARTAEIGLRRAIGASRGAIARLFLAEGGLTGALGGLGGSALGCAAIVGVAAVNHWTAHLQPWYLAAGPAVGLTVGIVASAYPAWQAAKISPAEAVRVE